MSKTARAAEPSMEEILASIRRIIADDSGTQARTAPRVVTPSASTDMQSHPGAPLSEPPAPENDILELTQPVDAPAAFTPVGGPDIAFREEEPHAPEPQMAPPPPPPPSAPRPMTHSAPVMSDERIMSASSSVAVSAAFNSLAATVLSDNARTLEDIVKDMMRPMLKNWLDENLPGMVERIVRAEIERVARGR
jgi:cell pole-organizing protein PopZ